MDQPSSLQKSILWFLLGTVVTGVGLGICVFSLKGQLRDAEDSLHREQEAEKLSSQQLDAGIQDKLQRIQSELQDSNQQRDACQSKFARGTFLYEQPILGGPSRQWMLPADVEPIYLGSKRGIYTHYDPKTQVETVQFGAKTK